MCEWQPKFGNCACFTQCYFSIVGGAMFVKVTGSAAILVVTFFFGGVVATLTVFPSFAEE